MGIPIKKGKKTSALAQVEHHISQPEQALMMLLYDAATNPEVWPQFLQQLQSLAQAHAVNLVFHDAQNRHRNLIIAPNHDAAFVDEYLASHIDNDVRYARFFLQKMQEDGIPDSEPFGTWQLQQLADRNQLLNPEMQTFLDDVGQYGHQIGVCGLQLNFTTALLGIHFRPDQALPNDEFFALLRRLQPHFNRAMRIHYRLELKRDSHRQLHDILHHTTIPLALLDADGRVHFTNHAAAVILDSHPAIRIGHNGRLQTPAKADQLRLDKALEQIARTPEHIRQRSPDGEFPLHHEKRRHPLKITLLPVHQTHLPVESALPACLAVFFNDPERRWHIPLAYLQQAYQLTSSECAIADALVNGGTVRSIATQRQTSEETVRWQLKCLLQKTRTGSQPELVRLLAALGKDRGEHDYDSHD